MTLTLKNMRTIKFYLALGLLIVLQSCSTGDNISDNERTTITKEIQGRLDGYSEAVRRKDSDWIQTFWADQKDFVLASDGKIETNLRLSYDKGIS